MEVAAAAAELAMIVLGENIGVDGTGTMSAGKKKLVGAGEAGCMLVASGLVGGLWKRKRVCHRLAEDTRRMLQPIWRER